MAETENGAEAQAQQIQMNVINQYVRDLSFENLIARKGAAADIQPDVQIQVNLDARKRDGAADQYEVAIKLTTESHDKNNPETRIFLMELDYVGLFHISGVPEDQMHPFLLIECPRLLFPFLRRIVSDVTRDGGFSPLNLDNIDFLALYRQELARQQAAQGAAQGDTPTN